ncbi:MAG: cation:proton antiporter [Campylobacterales bacterium]|nr:cation:proton antiporter [Campylobacterales bacterium]
MGGAITIIIALSLFIAVSPFISKALLIPIVVVEILLGILGNHFGFLEKNEYFFIIAKVGFLFLMFLAGLEVNLKEFAKIKSTLLTRVVLYFAMLYALALSIVLYFGLSFIYLVILPIFSLGMIMALLKDYGKDKPWLSLALLIGILGELISIVALTILSGAVSFGFGREFYKAMGTLALIVVAGVVFFRLARAFFWWFPETKRMIMPDIASKEQDIRFSMALFFVMIAIMLYLKIDMVLGAFFAGMFIAAFFAHKKDLHDKLSSFGFGFLAPIFFIYVGSTLKLDIVFSVEIFKNALFLIACMVSIRLIGSFSAFYGHLGFKNTLLFALSDSMPLMFMVAAATLGLQSGTIDNFEYSSIVVASMLDAITLMLVIKVLNFYFTKAER